MIDWLIEQQLVLSSLLIVLIFCETKLLPALGAKFCYGLYAAIPVALVLANMPEILKPELAPQISRYLVAINNNNVAIDNSVIWLTAWCVGCFIVIASSTFSHLQLRTAEVAIKPNSNTEALNLPDSLTPYVSKHVASPLLIGLLFPKLILPKNYLQMYSAKQLAMVIEHEVVHFKRQDTRCNFIALILLSLFWFNPLMWLGYKSFRRLQEISCDESVLTDKNTDEKIQYSKAMLLSIENTNNQLYAYTHYTEKQTMLKRLNFIKQKQQNKPFVKVTMLALIASLLSSMAIAENTPAAKSADEVVAPVMRVEPIYPEKAVKENLNGSVVLQFDVTAAGKVENVIVINAEPKKIFDKSAKIALRQWQYQSSSHGLKNQLVQLDFVTKNNEKSESLVERIKVTQ
ncbi:M56 family metallopeptidase [Thalassotalea nanhaiensis]|uniref:Protein TonB n=1 Tax=Thalassotalea nanhaiensis TaxID=3065648 RepID=A0ABY9TK21_9GAMM|nr:M56 family metallopeptidase [Colwelliaceae bacterium SQ345]